MQHSRSEPHGAIGRALCDLYPFIVSRQREFAKAVCVLPAQLCSDAPAAERSYLIAFGYPMTALRTSNTNQCESKVVHFSRVH